MIIISSDSAQELADFKTCIEFASITTRGIMNRWDSKHPDKKSHCTYQEEFEKQYKLTNENKLFVDKYNFTIEGEVDDNGNIIPLKFYEQQYSGKNIKDIEGI